MRLEIKIFLKPNDIANRIAEEIKDIVFENAKRGLATFIALSGGNTPIVLFNILSGNYYRKRIDWDNLHLFWGDERCVPPGDEQSNFGMVKNCLLDKISMPDKNIHRIIGENNPEDEVKRISEEIKSTVPDTVNFPRFDISILGLGTDGHTASLFPGKELKNVSDGIAGIAEHPDSGQKRISLTYEVINNSKRNIFMVTGEKKADILFRIMSENDPESRYPAARIKAAELLEWYLDEAAASKIKKP
jgi:6-phosphogluconolactonase